MFCVEFIQSPEFPSIVSTMEVSNLEASKQANLIVLCTVMLTLVALAVSLRCWSVFVSPTHKFGFDDFFAILALVSS